MVSKNRGKNTSKKNPASQKPQAQSKPQAPSKPKAIITVEHEATVDNPSGGEAIVVKVSLYSVSPAVLASIQLTESPQCTTKREAITWLKDARKVYREANGSLARGRKKAGNAITRAQKELVKAIEGEMLTDEEEATVTKALNILVDFIEEEKEAKEAA